MRSSSLPIVVVLALALAGCGALPGTQVQAWERTELAAGTLAAPDTVPEGLAFTPAERPLVRSDGTSRVLWLRAHVRWTALRDPVLLVPRAYVTFAAYVDGRRVLDASDYRAASGVPFYVVPLPADAHGEASVLLRVSSRYTQVGVPEGAYVGDRSALLSALVRRDAPRLVLAITMIAIGLGALLFALRGRQRRPLVAIALFSIGMAAWALFQTRTRQIWMPELALWFGAWWVAPSLTSLGASAFVESVFGAGPRRFVLWLRRFFTLHAALLALSLALPEGAFFALAPALFLSGRAVVLAGTLAITAWMVVLARRRDAGARWFLGGFSIAGVGIFHDVFVSLGVLPYGLLLSDVGYLVLELSWIAIVIARIEAVEREVVQQAESLARFVRERDELVRDLHDGIGGVVTNVRALAQRGADAEDGEQRPLLASIADLAGEGMHELRVLMAGYDALPPTWRAAAAELRRMGTSTLEPHGIAHAFELEVREEMPAPDLASYLGLVRVHREALTNVVKHADARSVRVRFVATPSELSLTVQDDGTGKSTSAEPGHGRGHASMRKRALALGAELTIEPASPGTRVRLVRRAEPA